jgi:hypothetical protein
MDFLEKSRFFGKLTIVMIILLPNMGILLVAPYLFYLSFSNEGDVIKMLVGERSRHIK